MLKLDVIRAWKDEEHRERPSEEKRKALPEHPSRMIELVDAELETVAGGGRTKRHRR